MSTFSQLIKENISSKFSNQNFDEIPIKEEVLFKINENKINKFNNLIDNISIENYFHDRLQEVFDSQFDENLVKNLLLEFEQIIIERDDDLKQILLESISIVTELNEWASDADLTFLTNDVPRNFSILKKIISEANVCQFMYYNRDGLPRKQYRKRTVEPNELAQNNGTRRIILSGFLTADFTKRNHIPRERFYLLSNMKNIKTIIRKTRVVRPTWAGGTIKNHTVLVTIADYFKPSTKKNTSKNINKKTGDTKIPTASKFGNKPPPKKSMFQPPSPNQQNDSDINGGFEED